MRSAVARLGAGAGLAVSLPDGVVGVGDGHPAGRGLGGQLAGRVVGRRARAVARRRCRRGRLDLRLGRPRVLYVVDVLVAAAVGEPGAVAVEVVAERRGDGAVAEIGCVSDVTHPGRVVGERRRVPGASVVDSRLPFRVVRRASPSTGGARGAVRLRDLCCRPRRTPPRASTRRGRRDDLPPEVVVLVRRLRRTRPRAPSRPRRCSTCTSRTPRTAGSPSAGSRWARRCTGS